MKGNEAGRDGMETMDTSSVKVEETKATRIDTEEDTPKPLELCGWGVEDANGSAERTEAMIGELIDWRVILKSTAPSKLLVRPPVRFLFDLFMTISVSTGFAEDLMSGSRWDELQAKKEKVRLMDRMALEISSGLGLAEAPAKGSD
ncbi:unnamed protein product, partial [Choristocarpus tenellus]